MLLCVIHVCSHFQSTEFVLDQISMTTLLAACSRSQTDLAVHAERFIAQHAGSYVGLERIALGWTEDGKLFVTGSGLAVLDVCPELRDMEVTG